MFRRARQNSGLDFIYDFETFSTRMAREQAGKSLGRKAFLPQINEANTAIKLDLNLGPGMSIGKH